MDVPAYARRVDSGAGPGGRRRLALWLVASWNQPQRRAFAGALVAAAASALAFARISEDYLTNDPLARWDVSFARWLSEHRSAAGVDVFRVVTDLGSPAVSLAVATVVCLVLLRRGRLADAALLPLALGGAELLNVALKLAFHRSRPEVGFVHLDTYSYPSGHVMVASATYGAFAYLLWGRTGPRRRWLLAAAMAAVVALIAASRLYLGVHYLSDVLGGLSAGVAWLFIVIALHVRWGDRFGAAFPRTRAGRLAHRLTRG